MTTGSLSKTSRTSKSVEITTVQRAHTKFTGFRTNIPATLARDVGLDFGDKISWETDKDEKGKFLKVRLHEKGVKKE